MSDVFLLGAGFSKAISADMPLLSDLSTQIKERLRESGTDLPSPLPTLGDNLELWLSYLSQPHPWLGESKNLKNQAMALDITNAVRETLNEQEHLAIQKECPTWLKELTRYWHKNKSGVITLNYDTLVERAAATIETGGKSTLTAGQLYPVPFTLASRRDGNPFSNDEVETFTLFKLHGSINWFYSGAADSTGETIYYTSTYSWERDDSRELPQQEAVSDKVPLIVPPTTEKVRFFQHESLKRIWTRALDSISQATRLFVLGYSLPMTDLAIRLFLNEVGIACPKKELYVVNRDCKIVDGYKELLGRTFEVNKKYVGENAVKRLVNEEFGKSVIMGGGIGGRE